MTTIRRRFGFNVTIITIKGDVIWWRESDLKINVLISKSHAHHMRHIGDGRRGYLVVNKDEFTFTRNNLACQAQRQS